VEVVDAVAAADAAQISHNVATYLLQVFMTNTTSCASMKYQLYSSF
jgi:hypothetical protein